MKKRPHKDTFRQLPNVVTLVTLIEETLDTVGTPLACYSGPTGFGKSMASVHASLDYGAVYVECEKRFTYKYFLEAVATELGLSKRGSANHLFDRVRDYLQENERMIIIDDAHFMTQKGIPHLARSFADKAGIPVILIGEEMLPNDLTAFPDVLGRIAGKVARAAPASLFDVSEISDVWLPDVTVADNLKEEILVKSQGQLRAVSEMLEDIYKKNLHLQRKLVGAEEFGGDQLLDPTKPPKVRGDDELGRRVQPVRRIA